MFLSPAEWSACLLKRRQMRCIHCSQWTQTYKIQFRSESSQNDFALLFFWIEAGVFIVCVFTQSNDDDEEMSDVFFVEGRFVFCNLKINQDGADQRSRSLFFTVFLRYFLIILHFIFIISISCQQVTNHLNSIEMLDSFEQTNCTMNVCNV